MAMDSFIKLRHYYCILTEMSEGTTNLVPSTDLNACMIEAPALL